MQHDQKTTDPISTVVVKMPYVGQMTGIVSKFISPYK